MKLENTKDEIYTDVTTKSTTPITARPHQTLQNVAQNKGYGKLQISSRILRWFSQEFLYSGSYSFVIFLLHRETLISQSLKKFSDSVIVHSPCKSQINCTFSDVAS